jgi:hypothetical protein
MIKIIFADFIHIFQPPTADEMVREELEQARRELLKAHSAEEYARSMSQYHQERITRLTSKSDASVTRPLRSRSGCATPLSTSTPSAFWPFERVDPRVLEAMHRATMTSRRTEQFNQLGAARL